jgi:radical SAM protein with 4Fe4S-binding SPASM domain
MLDLKLKFGNGHTSERAWMEPSDLRQLVWNATYACNFRCRICYEKAATRAPDELTTAEVRRLFARAAALGVRDVIVSGGEPFLRPDLPELLADLGALGITARVASNGSLLTRDLLDRLRRETRVLSFQISVDTLDPSLYEAVHGVSSVFLDRALAALTWIREAGFHTTVSTRLTPQTLVGLPALLDRAVAEGWATVTVHLPLLTGRAHDTFGPDVDPIESIEPVLEYFACLPGAWLVETYIPWAPCHPVLRRLAERVRVVHRGCRAGRDRLTVHPRGDVSPCVCLEAPEASCGNVRRDDLAAVFRDARPCVVLRAPWDHVACAGCPEVRGCGGGCRAAAIAAGGGLTGPDLSCPILGGSH